MLWNYSVPDNEPDCLTGELTPAEVQLRSQGKITFSHKKPEPFSYLIYTTFTFFYCTPNYCAVVPDYNAIYG